MIRTSMEVDSRTVSCHWQAGAWRQELRQLLELLAARADHRLHPLPWALPVPLRVQGRYSRAEVLAAHCFAEALRLRRR